VRIQRWPHDGNFAGVRHCQPDSAIRVITKKPIVHFARKIARPDNFGCVDIGGVEDPLFVDAVVGAIANEDDVLSRFRLEIVQKIGAVGKSPPAPTLRVAQPLRDQQGDIENQRKNYRAGKGRADGSLKKTHRAQVANRLDKDGEENCGRGRDVVRPGQTTRQ